jgi:hypothetical protein
MKMKDREWEKSISKESQGYACGRERRGAGRGFIIHDMWEKKRRRR